MLLVLSYTFLFSDGLHYLHYGNTNCKPLTWSFHHSRFGIKIARCALRMAYGDALHPLGQKRTYGRIKLHF